MKKRNFADYGKNAVGTVFLLAGAFFMCSTFLSMRSVLADPIAPTAVPVTPTTAQSPRAATSQRASGRGQSSRTVSTARTTSSGTTVSRSVSARPSSASRATTSSASGATISRAVTSRGVTSRGNSTSARTASNTSTRNVRARTATSDSTARVSLSGSAIRGSKTSTTTGSTYSYLSSKLYTGNYSNIIDSSTGLISAEAYNNCMESYYACMDEICTARNAAQRRCACAGRVKGFAEAQTALESANEELIKVSGELALLVATGGKDVSSAFQLTDAEQVMNCVSWQEVKNKHGDGSSYMKDWCYNHGFYDGNGNGASSCEPSYCRASGNNFGFNVSDINGNSSDILASLQSWAEAKATTLTITGTDNDNLLSSLTALDDVVSNMSGLAGNLSLTSSSETSDTLASTWGYELFEYAHNNVCSRVLDSCFNGIYETCGNPASFGGKCANGTTTTNCPFNYNSKISVDSNGDVALYERSSSYTTSSSTSATCFGYTSASGDPYSSLRGPVADSRRSIMQKYLLDANADCDAYGEQLRTQAQNIGYQKVAAQQALQQKRLEFAQNETEQIATDYRNAISNFNECLSDLFDCYTEMAQSNSNWSTSRIKTYCAQVAQVPSCYETMICGAPNSQLMAVIDKNDSVGPCDNSNEYGKNTCRNVVTLSEILSPSYTQTATTGSSAALRESCLQSIGINGVRTWERPTSDEAEWDDSTKCSNDEYYDVSSKTCVKRDYVKCGATQHWNQTTESCDDNVVSCSVSHAKSATKTWNSGLAKYGDCTVFECDTGYTKSANGLSCTAEQK
ncbi:hypothetical protein HDR66_01770 [bacterium]|nr:hypothetical protein [bacterium]